MNKWFEETFLASIFKQVGVNKNKWLTQKQTAICVQNMEKHTVRQAQFQGDYTSHNYFTCVWQGRKVHLSYSKLNGCGVIEFYMNDEEEKEAQKRIAEEREKIEADRIESIKKNTERLRKTIEKLEKKIFNHKKEIHNLYVELANNNYGESYDKHILEDIEIEKDDLEKAQTKLEKYTN